MHFAAFLIYFVIIIGERGEDTTRRMLASVIDRGETKARRKHVIPDPVTTPRRGPLWLRGRRCREETRGRSRNSRSQLADVSRAPVLPRKSAKTSLNRLPVVMIQRPLDHIEATLGGLSCCLLQERVAVMEVSCTVLLYTVCGVYSEASERGVLFTFHWELCVCWASVICNITHGSQGMPAATYMSCHLQGLL